MRRAFLVLGLLLSFVASAVADPPLVGSGGARATVKLIAASGSAQALTPKTIGDSVYDITLTANTAFTLASGTVGQQQTIVVYLRQDGTAGRAPTFGANVNWQAATAPTLNTLAGFYDVLQFSTVDGGASYAGLLVGSQISAPSVPGAVTGPLAVAGNVVNTLSANAMTANPATLSYNLYRSTTSGGEGSTPYQTGLSTPAYSDTGVSNGTTYYYTWAAVNALGTGPQSAEINATPSVTAYGHFYAFGATTPRYVYVPGFNSQFSPGANAFSIIWEGAPASVTPASSNTLIAKWATGSTPNANQEWWLGQLNNGKLEAAWVTVSNTEGTCTSSVAPAWSITVPLRVRVDVTPTTGLCKFYTAPTGTNLWTQLGTDITSGVTGAVQSANTFLEAGNVYGNGTYFSGNFYNAQLSINGTVITAPVVGAASVTDSYGWTWTASGGTFN